LGGSRSRGVIVSHLPGVAGYGGTGVIGSYTVIRFSPLRGVRGVRGYIISEGSYGIISERLPFAPRWGEGGPRTRSAVALGACVRRLGDLGRCVAFGPSKDQRLGHAGAGSEHPKLHAPSHQMTFQI
jgi:hypothetical protein